MWVGVAQASRHFALQEGDILLQIQNAQGPFTDIKEVEDIFAQYPYRMVNVSVLRHGVVMEDIQVVPNESGKLFRVTLAVLQDAEYAEGILAAGCSVRGVPDFAHVVAGVVAVNRYWSEFKQGDIVMRVHNKPGPFVSMKALKNALDDFKYRLIDVEVQRGNDCLCIPTFVDAKGNFVGAQLGILKPSPLNNSFGIDSQWTENQLKTWLHTIGIPRGAIFHCARQLFRFGMDPHQLSELTHEDIARMGIWCDVLQEAILNAAEELKDHPYKNIPCVGMPAVLRVTGSLGIDSER